MTSPLSAARQSLRDRVLAVARGLDEEAISRRTAIDAVLPMHRASALNLAHYLSLRRHDVRGLQRELAAIGLSSLGRCEGHVHDTVDRLGSWLAGDGDAAVSASGGDYPDSGAAEHLLHANARALLGPRPKDRHVYIMVTAPAAADATGEWADSLLEAGANLLRINAAHETPREWDRIAATFRDRAAAMGVPVRVLVDLPGPKLRAEIRQFEPSVVHVPRIKDAFGRTVGATRVGLVGEYIG